VSTRECEFCSAPVTSSAPTARFCTARCRKRSFLARRQAAAAVSAPAVGEGAAGRAVLTELEAAGRHQGHLAASALVLARQIDGATALRSVAAEVKELRAVMLAALAGVQSAADALDELRGRRDRKRAG